MTCHLLQLKLRLIWIKGLDELDSADEQGIVNLNFLFQTAVWDELCPDCDLPLLYKTITLTAGPPVHGRAKTISRIEKRWSDTAGCQILLMSSTPDFVNIWR